MKETIINALLSSAVYPLIVGCTLATVLSRLFAKDRERDWIAALSLLAGFLVCFYTTVGFASFPPVKVFDWLPYVSLLGLVAMFLAALASLKWRLLAVLVAVLLGTFLSLRPVSHAWTSGNYVAVLMLCALVWFSLWGNYDRAQRDTETRLLLMVILSTAVSILSVLSHSAKVAQVSGGLAAACGSLLIARLVTPSLRLGAITNATFMVALGYVLLNAFFYVEVPLYAICLVLLSALSHLLLKLPALDQLTALKRGGLVICLSLFTVIGAISVLALTPQDTYDY